MKRAVFDADSINVSLVYRQRKFAHLKDLLISMHYCYQQANKTEAEMAPDLATHINI